MNYLLDTNILVIYIRDTDVTRKLEDQLNLFSGANNLVISAVSLGEVKSIALRNKWGNKKLKKFAEIVDKFLISDINIESIIDKYAEIDAFSQAKLSQESPSFTARNMGKNDLWIAATASVYDLELLTTDKDFEHLSQHYLTLNRIVLS